MRLVRSGSRTRRRSSAPVSSITNVSYHGSSPWDPVVLCCGSDYDTLVCLLCMV
eukprot:jgi/Botrbrau1/16925/Bobra.0266s0001.1